MAAGIAAVSPMFGMGWSKGVSQMFTAEPEHYADAAASLASGIIVANSGGAPTDCDALLAPSLGANPFRILRHYKVKGLIASEGDMKAALAIAHEHFKLVLEPGGAIGLACALRHRERFRDAVVVVIASGGNVDPEKHAHLLVQGRKIAPQLLKTSCG